MGSEPVVVSASGVDFELVESITSVESGGDWHTVLVFCVYGDVEGGRATLCETRVEVQHWRGAPSTEVRLLAVTDCYGGRGELMRAHWHSYYRRVKAGRLRVPERGRDLLSHERPRRRVVAEAVEAQLWRAVHLYGAWPHLQQEEAGHAVVE